MPEPDSTPPELSVVIPMFREARRILPTLDDVIDTLVAGSRSSEIVLVDDGSPDGTVDAVRPKLSETPKGSLGRVILAKHPMNRGKGAAVRTGLAVARGRWRLMMDADNAARVREVERLFPSTSDPRVALVCGSRNAEGAQVQSRAFRRFAGLVFRAALGALGLNLLRDTQCGFKLYRADLAKVIAKVGREDRFAFDLEHLLIAKRTGLIREVGIAWEHKDGGTVSPIRDGVRMLIRAARIRSRFLIARPNTLVEPKPLARPSPTHIEDSIRSVHE